MCVWVNRWMVNINSDYTNFGHSGLITQNDIVVSLHKMFIWIASLCLFLGFHLTVNHQMFEKCDLTKRFQVWCSKVMVWSCFRHACANCSFRRTSKTSYFILDTFFVLNCTAHYYWISMLSHFFLGLQKTWQIIKINLICLTVCTMFYSWLFSPLQVYL